MHHCDSYSGHSSMNMETDNLTSCAPLWYAGHTFDEHKNWQLAVPYCRRHNFVKAWKLTDCWVPVWQQSQLTLSGKETYDDIHTWVQLHYRYTYIPSAKSALTSFYLQESDCPTEAWTVRSQLSALIKSTLQGGCVLLRRACSHWWIPICSKTIL